MKTIKSSLEISRIFEEGRRIGAPEFSVIVLKNEKQHDREGRVAFIAGKKLGNAVWRNKAKRRMRSACYELGGAIPQYDVIFLARRKVAEAAYGDLKKHMANVISKISLKYD